MSWSNSLHTPTYSILVVKNELSRKTLRITSLQKYVSNSYIPEEGKSDNLKRNTWDVHSGIYSAMWLSCNSQDNLGGASKAEQTCLTPKTFLLRMKKMQQSKEKINHLKPHNQWRSLPSKKPLVIVYKNNIPENTFLSNRWWMSKYMHVHKRNKQKHKTDNEPKSNFTFPKFNSIAPENNSGWKTILPIGS